MENSEKSTLVYANRHIEDFLALPETQINDDEENPVQVVHDGASLTSASVMTGTWHLDKPMLVVDRPESIGMKLPRPKSGQEAVSVRDIADIVGHTVPLSVIDVEHQEELEGWAFGDLVDYFEDEDRLAVVRREQAEEASGKDYSIKANELSDESFSPGRQKLRRKASVKFLNKTRHRVLNQISYEFSKTDLRTKVRSPQFVRDLDWIDQVWPERWRHDRQIYPVVQYYCLTSAAGCYTDFHVDFGGTSVWYHVLSGRKLFCLIPPTTENMGWYEKWLCSKNQAADFLPNLMPSGSKIFKIALKKNQTLIIPSGWIHSVYTPVDSLVFGGNFLHGLAMDTQIKVNSLEVRNRVLERFRFPFFIPTQFYACGWYLAKLRRGDVSQCEVNELPVLVDALEQWWGGQTETTGSSFENSTEPSIVGAATDAAMMNNCPSVLAMLEATRQELGRVLRDGICRSTVLPSQNPTKTQGVKTLQKIRLKIKSPDVRSPPDAASSTSKPKPTFRIRLSNSSRLTEPLPKPVQRNRPKGDMASFVDEKEVIKDDEWLPSGTSLKRESPCDSSPQVKAPESPKGAKRQKSKPTSARQRLLKKAKW